MIGGFSYLLAVSGSLSLEFFDLFNGGLVTYYKVRMILLPYP